MASASSWIRDYVAIGRGRLVEAEPRAAGPGGRLMPLPIDRASHCSSPAWWISIAPRSASPRSGCLNRPAARSKCRVRRPAAASPPTIPVIGAPARDLAGGILDAFGGYDFVVVPSGSCGGMLKHHLPHLFDDDPNLRARADALGERTFELVSFLADVMGVERRRRGISAAR